MSTVKKQIDYKKGQLGWLLWAAFGRVIEDSSQYMNFDQAVKSFLPGCSNYDLDLAMKTLWPEMKKLLKGKKLDFAGQQVLMQTRERLLEEFRRRELPVPELKDA